MYGKTPTIKQEEYEIRRLFRLSDYATIWLYYLKRGDGMTHLKRDLRIFMYCLLIAAACLAICSKSSPLYPLNDWTDANAYFSCGKGMLSGMIMYRDLFEHKGPMLYALHALCALISSNSFLGVFLMEIFAVALFLLAAYKTLSLNGIKRSAWILLPVAAALTLSSLSFSAGDSAEELCLPMLAWPLYFLLRWIRQQAPDRMPAKTLLISGLLCGFVLWIKFTLLGFFVPWIAGLFFYHLSRHKVRYAFASIGWFLCGIVIATLPWIVYFGVNGAIGDWFTVYLYDNLFLYSQTETLTLLQRFKVMLHVAWDWFIRNPAYTLPMAAGVIWFTVSRRYSAAEKIWIWSLMLFLGLGVFIGGKPYVYYGFIFAAFAAFILLPVCLLLDHVPGNRKVLRGLLAMVLCIVSLFACFALSPNTHDLLRPKENTMQYRFAAVINQVPDATLLNYFFMDSGFYTAANVTPSVKYFHYTNVPLAEMLEEQDRYIAEGVTDFVVTRGRQPDTITDQYTLVASEPAPDGYWYDAVYLYERNDLLTSD